MGIATSSKTLQATCIKASDHLSAGARRSQWHPESLLSVLNCSSGQFRIYFRMDHYITSTHNLEHPCSKSAPNKGGLIFSGFAFQNERSRRLQEVVWPRPNRRLWGQTSFRRRNHRTYTMSCTFTRLLEHSSLRMESNFLNISFYRYKGIWRYFCKRKKKKRKSGKKSGKKSSKRKQKRQRSPAPKIDLTNM